MSENMIQLIYNEENTKWQLFNNNSLECCSDSIDRYTKHFINSLDEEIIEKCACIGIVGGGDGFLLDALAVINPSAEYHIIDPEISTYFNMKELPLYYYQDENNVSTTESTFEEYYQDKVELDIVGGVFDIIYVDVSEDIIEEANSLYRDPDILSKLSKFLVKGGHIVFYTPPGVYLEESRFDIKPLYYNSVYIPEWGEEATFNVYRKDTKEDHCHWHVIMECEGSFPTSDNILNTSKFILNKYANCMTDIEYQFDDINHSGCIILGESHFNWHTYFSDKNNEIVFDLYHCKGNRSMDAIFEELAKRLNISIKNLDFKIYHL